MKIEILAGTSIQQAIDRAKKLTESHGESVSFDFNNIPVMVSLGDDPAIILEKWNFDANQRAMEYRESPEGQAAQRQRDMEIEIKQWKIDEMLGRFSEVVYNQDGLMDWISEFSDYADDSGVSFNKSEIVRILEIAGYRRNDCVGKEPSELGNSRRLMARYIIGQAIDCLSVGMPPHPMTMRFVEDYRSIKSTN